MVRGGVGGTDDDDDGALIIQEAVKRLEGPLALKLQYNIIYQNTQTEMQTKLHDRLSGLAIL